MVPSAVGNTISKLVTGAFVKHYGRYKLPTIMASLSSGFCYALLLVFWRSLTEMPLWQCLFVFLSSPGTAAVKLAVFVALAAGVAEEDVVVAGSGLYLTGNIGECTVSGIATVRANTAACRRDHSVETTKQALSDIPFVQGLGCRGRELVVAAYVARFENG